ncbi:MAG: hypothetical protein PHX60_05210 [Giesbergeria sp.]|uniref:hypothetical protein n=1 Tax=Giesbergeria sp. TaxID=2818473 RepID=UPI00261A854D|nr:hypothetical protein [Giesbergeria sp.]MDD2609082.1 hypothetical protein [Giesbergeria sp.]
MLSLSLFSQLSSGSGVSALPQMPRRDLLRAVGVWGLCASTGAVWAQLPGPNASAWLHRASRVGALAQRLAKIHLQLHLKVQPDDAKLALEPSQRLVQSTLEEMAKVAWPADIAGHVAQLRKHFEVVDQLVQAPPTRESSITISSQADQMLAAAEVLFHGLERLGKAGMHPLIQACAGLRMRSQRLAKNYFLQAAGQDMAALREQRQADLDECKRIFSTLNTAPVSNSSLRTELMAADMQWVFFTASFGRDPDPRGLRAMAGASERLLEIADNLTLQYEVALKDQRSPSTLPAP